MNWTLIPRLAMLSLLVTGGCTKADDTDGDTDTDTDTDSDTDTDTDADPEICDDGDDNDGDGDADCDDRDCRNDDACAEPEYFEPTYVAVYADFGWDAENNKVITVTGVDDTGADVEVPPTVTIVLLSEDQTESCYIQYVSLSNEFDPSNWSGKNDFGTGTATEIDHTGFVLDTTAEASAYSSDCAEVLDPGVWGDDFEATMQAWMWGGGVGNPHADVEANFDAIAEGNGIDVGVIFGAGFFVGQSGGTAADGDYIAASWGIAFALDEAHHVVVDDEGAGVFLQASDVVNETGVPPTGFYRSIPAYVFGVDFLVP